MNRITVYCAFCLRPLLRSVQLTGWGPRTETCDRTLVWRRRVTPSGFVFWENDGEMKCTTWVLTL